MKSDCLMPILSLRKQMFAEISHILPVKNYRMNIVVFATRLLKFCFQVIYPKIEIPAEYFHKRKFEKSFGFGFKMRFY
jgi:hypothetical protein